MIAEKTGHRETVKVASRTSTITSEVHYGFVYIDKPIFGRADTNDDGDFDDSEEQFYYTTNNLYNVVALLDTSGNIIERYDYKPYGEVTVYVDDGGDSDWSDGISRQRVHQIVLWQREQEFAGHTTTHNTIITVQFLPI